MCADRDSSSSPGFRALLGRFLHGLLQYRVFQLLGAAWSYLMGLSGASFFSFLPSAWVVHRSVGPDEFPEMLEAFGLRSGPWEELGDCLEELGPWKELLSPAMKGYVSSSKEQESWDSTLEELGSWQSKMQALWEPGLGTWKDVVDSDQEEDECHSKSSANSTFSSSHHRFQSEIGLGDGDKSGARLPASPLGMVSCIFNPGSSGVFTWLDLENEFSLQKKDVPDEICNQTESEVEIQHIRDKRLWFLQQNQRQDVPSTDPKADDCVQEDVQTGSDLNDPAFLELGLSACDWHNKDLSPDSQLWSDLELDQRSVLELPVTDPNSKSCHPLTLLVQKPYIASDTQSKDPPSPDQDQGYHSLEDWQCPTIIQNLQSELGWDNAAAHVPTELSCSAMKDLQGDQDSDDMDSDLEEEIQAPAIPACTNKHIGYILGTVVSDEEDPDSQCEDDDDWDDEEDDDGFDSEGSVSGPEGDIPVPKGVVLWNSFGSVDPYNPQNFTASLHTGPITEVNSHLEDQEAVVSDDEESWCDSDAVSDSEEEFSADEQENLKLWNGFLKTEDPYNPFFFKASVQTSQQNGQSGDAASRPVELVCTSPSSCELTVPTYPKDARPLGLREKYSVSKEESANNAHKKVTFHDQVTIYYICNEEERKGHWEEFARDRCRFQRRIQETECTIGHCFTPDHRQRVWKTMQEIWDS